MMEGTAIRVGGETREDAVVSYLDLSAVAVPPEEEPRPFRLAVPLLLAAGWGALLTFSMIFLMEDGRDPSLSAERTRTAQWVDPDPAREERTRRAQAATAIAAADPAPAAPAHPAPAAAARLKVAAASVDDLPAGPASPVASGPAATAPASRLPAADRAAYVGTWGPNAKACGERSRRRGYLPALITEDTAKAGRTLCRFRNGRHEGSTWTMSADCTDRGRSWTSQVRLVVDGDRLTWTSARGSTAYVRCGRRDG